MTCRSTIFLSLLTIGLTLAGCDKSKTNKSVATPEETLVCPVMPDKKVVRSFYVDHEDKRVYLCCNTCVKVFKKKPEKYLAKASELGITFEDIPNETP